MLVVSWRFNRNGLIVERPLNDAAYYIANVQVHRGEEPDYQHKGPFNERVLVTAIAAALPLPPLTAINVVNVLFLLLALYCLFLLLRETAVSSRLIWLGLYLFVFSFPTFYYSTIGYTDPGVLAMIFLGAYAVQSQKAWLFLLAIGLGTLAKENIVILLSVAAVYAVCHKNYRWAGVSVAALLIFVLLTLAVKMLVSEGENRGFYWQPLPNRVQFNLARPNFYLSTLFGLGLPWLWCLLLLAGNLRDIGKHWRTEAPLWAGTLCSLVPWAYMIFSAFPDGRVFWVASCYPIALAVSWTQRYGLSALGTILLPAEPTK